MAGADLTRFDFNAKSFTHSDNVRAMSLEEIGQYVLLLCEAWLTDKEATLPDEIDALTTMCRGKKPSKRVLEMFPVVPELGRRRNQRLYGEWVLAKKRSDDGRKAVETRWDKQTNTDEIRPHNESISGASELVLPKPNQSEPIQSNPNQHGSNTFKFIAVRYSSFFGINHSHSKKHIEKYSNACARFGEDLVLSVFDRWADSAGWLKERRDSNGLNFFWKPMEEIIEGDQLRFDREESVRKPDADLEKQMAAQIRQENLKDEAAQDQEKEKRRKQKEFEAENADQI